MVRHLLVAASVVALTTSAAARSEGVLPHLIGLKPISSVQLEKRLRGNTLSNVLSGVSDWKVHYASDGVQRGSSGSDIDQGRWRVVTTRDGASLCTTWSRWRPAEKCFPVLRNRKNELVGFDGSSVSWVGRVSPGNPLGY